MFVKRRWRMECDKVELGAKLTATDKSGNANKTAACYETSVIVACATLVEPLQRAWRDLPASRLISLNEWMKNDNPDRQTIILGASGDYDVATGKLIGVLFRLMKGIMTSATFAESFDRRLLFVVDELSVFAAKGDPIASIKEFGRSKGIGLVIGIQNWAQLKKEYDTDGVANLQSLFELQILVCHAQTLSDDDGSGALAAKYIGKGSFVRWVGTTGKNANRSQKDEERLVVEPGYFTSELGSKPGDKIRAAVLIKNNLCTLDWPIMKSWVPRRVACKDAAWISTPTAEELERAAGTSTY